MTKTRAVTLGKFEPNAINEDSAIARKNVIAVSDGAGGGGLFADRWSGYLLQNLPAEPIICPGQLDDWIGGIWEKYYNKAEESAKRMGGMALDKFYDEGSFATLAAVWRSADNIAHWMAYGDSIVFHYDYINKELKYSCHGIADFNRPPHLINCKDELDQSGFKSGTFTLNDNSLVFIASDALSHYILMMYELSRRNVYSEEIREAVFANTKNSNLLKRGLTLPSFSFEKEVIDKLRKAVYDKSYCRKWLTSLYDKGLLALDDYSLALMSR